jgi:hypothetical protein
MRHFRLLPDGKRVTSGVAPFRGATISVRIRVSMPVDLIVSACFGLRFARAEHGVRPGRAR